jgi:ABC-2 type transport system permease protein
VSDALRAEWTKLRTLTGTWWLVAGAAVLTVAASAGIAASTHVSAGGAGAGGGASQDSTKLALVGVDVGQTVFVVLAVLAIAEEYATGMIRVTLTATPRRLLLLGAKAITVAGAALIAALPAVAGCVLAGRLLLPGAGLDAAHGYALVSIAHGPTLRAAIGCVLYLGLVALLSLGIATVVRDTAVSTGVVLGLLYLPPLLAALVTGPWRRHLQQLAPMSAGLAIQATRELHSLPISPWGGLGVLAAWAAGSLMGAAAVLRWRDA